MHLAAIKAWLRSQRELLSRWAKRWCMDFHVAWCRRVSRVMWDRGWDGDARPAAWRSDKISKAFYADILRTYGILLGLSSAWLIEVLLGASSWIIELLISLADLPLVRRDPDVPDRYLHELDELNTWQYKNAGMRAERAIYKKVRVIAARIAKDSQQPVVSVLLAVTTAQVVYTVHRHSDATVWTERDDGANFQGCNGMSPLAC